SQDDFDSYTNESKDATSVYNNNKNFSDKDAFKYGSISYYYEDTIQVEDFAQPFEKNLITFPVKGETVVILKINKPYTQAFWLPYSATPYPAYRRGKLIFERTKRTNDKDAEKIKYDINEKVKYLKPKSGDTIMLGRNGSSIRFSDTFSSANEKKKSPGIFITNKQNDESINKPIGELVEENFDMDGSSIYLTSEEVNVKFDNSNFSKFNEKKAYTSDNKGIPKVKFPINEQLKGNQIWIKSDRIILISKAAEFIVFSKGNVGTFTDERFTVDAAKEIYLQSDSDVIVQSGGNGKQIFLNSDQNGKIFLGKNDPAGPAGSPVQKMVLGGELVQILTELITAITQQWYATPAGPTPMMLGPMNVAQFTAIQAKLQTILSNSNFLSKM
ncbi:MAG: hypothetical protein RLZZ196_2444, partial [Bacteroidota bacterium]